MAINDEVLSNNVQSNQILKPSLSEIKWYHFDNKKIISTDAWCIIWLPYVFKKYVKLRLSKSETVDQKLNCKFKNRTVD